MFQSLAYGRKLKSIPPMRRTTRIERIPSDTTSQLRARKAEASGKGPDKVAGKTFIKIGTARNTR